MPRFVFQFESLLKYRRNQRDLCQQLLAKVLADKAADAETHKTASYRLGWCHAKLKQHEQAAATFAAFAAKAAEENAVLCGHIDEEMMGQAVRVAGMVASVHQSFTRDRRPFASVMLEDLDGRAEVMVWPDVYTTTKELWEEGSIVLVEGKVRLRNDQLQLSCDNIRRYQLDSVPPPEPEEPPPPPPPKSRLTISMKQTEDIDADVAYLNKLVDTLRIFPGEDEVNMCVVNGDRIVNLKLSNISTNYCPELHQRLVELVGEAGLRVGTNG